MRGFKTIVNKKAKAFKPLFIKRSNARSDIAWNDDWNIADAVRWICVPGSSRHKDVFSDSQLLHAFDAAATLGKFSQLNDLLSAQDAREMLDDYRKLVLITGFTCRQKDETKFPGAIWIRLALEAEVSQASTLKEALLFWDREKRSSHIVPLLLRKSEKDAAWKGLKQSDPAYNGGFGYTTEEVLSKKWRSFSKSLVDKWKLKFHDASKPATSQKTTRSRQSFKELTTKKNARHGAPLNNETCSSVVVPKKPLLVHASAPVNASTRLKNYEVKCGRIVMEDLRECLEKEAQKTRGRLVTPSHDKKRLYDCDLSLDQLVEALQKSYLSIRDCSASNIKRALSAYVACPRGRPRMGNKRRLSKKTKARN